MIFATVFIVIATIIIVNFVQRRMKIHKYSKHFASPPTHPIFGNLLLYPKDISKIFLKIMDLHNEYGKNIVSWGVLNEHVIQLTNQKDVETILLAKTSQAKSLIYEFLNPWLSTGLLTSHGKKWFQRRRIITPTFHFKILEKFIDVFNQQSEILVNKLSAQANKGTFDVYDNITLYALDVICEAAMGVTINAQDNPGTDYVMAVKEISTIVFKRIFSILASYPTIYNLTPMARRQKTVVKVLHDFTDKVIKERKEQLLDKPELIAPIPSDNDEFNDDEMYGKKKLTFLDLLLSATEDGKPLDNASIREEVDTFMFEGHDTTTSGISFAIYHLSRNPDVQQKVFEEQQNLFGSNTKTTATYNDYQNMKYLEMVIKESQRIHPSVSIIGRRTTEETVVDGVTLPADVNIIIPIFQIHRDPEVYPNPLKFDPERFNDENFRKRGPYDYIPFSAGPRNCIGQRFAMLDMKSALSKIVRHFHILPNEKGEEVLCKSDLVLRPVNGIQIQLKPRIY